jgi:hypothetical protein
MTSLLRNGTETFYIIFDGIRDLTEELIPECGTHRPVLHSGLLPLFTRRFHIADQLFGKVSHVFI